MTELIGADPEHLRQFADHLVKSAKHLNQIASHIDNVASSSETWTRGDADQRNLGEGTKEQPWQVLRASDEYDILEVLGRQAKPQSAHDLDGVLVDEIGCEDGSIVWFAFANKT